MAGDQAKQEGSGGVSPALSVASAVGAPSILTAIIALFTMLPKIWGVFESMGRLAKDARFNSWLDELETTTKDLEHADNLRDRIEAAKRLASLTRRL